MDVVDRIMEPGQRPVDELAPNDGLVAPGDEHRGPELANGADGSEVGLDHTVAVAPQRVEVRKVREERSHQVADETDAVLGKPHDAAVDGLAAGRGHDLEIDVADAESEATIEGDVGDGLVLAHGDTRVLGRDLPRPSSADVEPDGGCPQP